jgi:hypothetical protein
MWETRKVNDSSPQAEAVRLALIKRMSPSRRFAMATGWSNSMRELVRANLKRQFDGASENFVRRRLAERWLGTELAAKVYGPLDTHG